MKSQKINVTKDYRLFTKSNENRLLCLKKHRKLESSMKRYGFLTSFPLSVSRDKHGKLIVKDGQHRLAIAEHLNLPVYWVEEEVDYDVAAINLTFKTWQTRDYAEKHAANGKKAYIDGLEFADRHKIAVGTAFAMLAGTASFSACEQEYKDGGFTISDRSYAEMVAGIYGPISAMSSLTRNSNFLAACMAVCRVDGFDPSRMLRCAERCRERLVSYSTRDAYLDMMEDIYNFQQKRLVALKMEAIKAMRSRSASVKSAAQRAMKAADNIAHSKA